MRKNYEEALYSAKLKDIEKSLNEFLEYKKEYSLEKRKKLKASQSERNFDAEKD